MFENVFNGMFGRLGDSMCRLSMNGGIAVKTPSGYKTYNMKTGNLVNCANFVFPTGGEFFFVVPTNKVEVGDIVLIGGEPKCVIEVGKNTITVINYKDSTVDTVLPERHMFMGNTYFYGKIVSMFGSDILGDKKGKNVSKIMKYMMMCEMMKGNGATGGNAFGGNMLPFMLMSGNGGDFFGGMFDGLFNDLEDVEDDADDYDEEEEIAVAKAKKKNTSARKPLNEVKE